MSDLTPAQRTEMLERQLYDHGHLDSHDIDAAVAVAESASGDSPSPALGARVVARAWVDAEFRARLLADPVNTMAEYQPQTVPIAVLEDTPSVHHVIVCTLCSCYPNGLLGNAPTWYKSLEYRSRVVREPRAVLAEFGTQLDPAVELRVHDSTAEQRYLVLPLRPAGTESWNEEQLAALVTRNSMIGTGNPTDALTLKRRDPAPIARSGAARLAPIGSYAAVRLMYWRGKKTARYALGTRVCPAPDAERSDRLEAASERCVQTGTALVTHNPGLGVAVGGRVGDVGPRAEGVPQAGDGSTADLCAVHDRTVGEPGIAFAAKHGDSGHASQPGWQHPRRAAPGTTPGRERKLFAHDGEGGRDLVVRARLRWARDPRRIEEHSPALVREVERRKGVLDRRANRVSDAPEHVEHRQVGDKGDSVGKEVGGAPGRPPQAPVSLRREAVEPADQVAPRRVFAHRQRQRVRTIRHNSHQSGVVT
jgi:Nitrile hydratase, alpha chain